MGPCAFKASRFILRSKAKVISLRLRFIRLACASQAISQGFAFQGQGHTRPLCPPCVRDFDRCPVCLGVLVVCEVDEGPAGSGCAVCRHLPNAEGPALCAVRLPMLLCDP